jgi:hypothetical protein
VYASHDHFDMALWDDVADAITYCNHYLAASNADLADIAATFAAYAKYEVRHGFGGGARMGWAGGGHRGWWSGWAWVPVHQHTVAVS